MATFTLFNQATPTGASSGAGNAGTNGIHFTVSAACTLQGIWHWSPATSTQLPTTIALYTTQASPATGTLVTSQAASWSGAAGSGWVFAAFTTPPALTAGTNYMAANWRNDATNEWFVLYSVTWPVTSGILTAPKDTGTGQGWFNTGTPTALTFPSSQLPPDNFGMDVQVSTGGTVPFTPPQRQVRGRPAARKARLASTAPPAASPPPSPFRLPGLLRGRPQGAKSRLILPKFPPAVPTPPPTPSPFAPPSGIVRGRPKTARGRLGASKGAPVVPPTPSPFSPPASIWRAHMAVRKARLSSSAGSPAVPPPPFATPRSIMRAHQLVRKARLSSARGTAVPPPPFPTPRTVQRGKAVARKSRLASSAGSPAVINPITPSPFSPPALVQRGKAALRRARLGSSAGSPAIPTVIGPVGSWSGGRVVPSGFIFPPPAAQGTQVSITNTPGDWLFAVTAWRPTPGAADVSVSVADDARNWWEPVGSPVTDSSSGGAVRVSVWAAPAARVANPLTGVTVVQVNPTGPVLSMVTLIVDFKGLQPWYQVALVPGSNFANAATSLSASAGAPSARALLLTGFGTDDNSKTLTGPTGWSGLSTVSIGNGVDHTADIKITPAWQVVTGSASASVSASGALDLAGVIAGVLVSAPQPAQPNPVWPVMTTEVAIGAGFGTPPSELSWTALSGKSLSLSVTQGKQYSLGAAQAAQGTLLLDDPDAALIPPGTGIYTGIDSGTPVRRRLTWPGLAGSPSVSPHYVAFSGFMNRWPFNIDENTLRGQVQAQVTDAYGYGNDTLNAMAIEECLLDNPHSLWPLNDPAGSTGAGNLVPNGPPLVLQVSKYGAGSETVTWGSNSGALVGMSSAQVTSSGKSGGGSGMPQFTLAGLSLSTVGYGYALTATDDSYPPVSGGVTIEAFAQPLLGAPSGFTVPTGTGATFSTTVSMAAGQAVVATTASGFTFPTGITAGSIYFVLGNGGTSFQLSPTPGGGAVNITGAGAGFLIPTTAWNPVIIAARVLGKPVCGLEVDKFTGNLWLRYLPAGATGPGTTVVVDTSRDYRETFLGHFSLSFNQTTWRVMTNGGGLIVASGTFSAPLPAAFTDVSFAGVMDRTSQGLGWSGYLGGPAGVYPGFSAQNRVVSRYWGTQFGMVSDAAAARVERVLEYGGLTGRRWIGQQGAQYEGDLVASGQDIGGQAAVSSVNNIAASTFPASAYIAPTGDFTYQSKAFAWNQPVRWALGTNVAAGQIPFTVGSMATDYDPSRVTGSVQLTQLDSQAVTTPNGVMSATTMGAVAAAAGRQYGAQPYQATGYLEADWSSAYTAGSSLVDLANWIQAVYAKPANRIQSVTVDAASHPEAWPFWGLASTGDMVSVNVSLPTATNPQVISLIARITQTARSSKFSLEGTPAATITCTLDFAPEYQALTCDDPVRGLLDGSNVLPW